MTATMAPVGVILAGGQSRRMGGGDKTLAVFGGRPILAHVVDRFAPQVAALALNANGDAARFAGFGLPVLADMLPDGVADWPGPLAGILAAMGWAAEQGAGHVVTVAGDTPFVPCDLVPRLQWAAEAAPIAIAASAGRAHPTAALWPVTLRADLGRALAAGTRRVGEWADEQGAVRVDFAPGPPDPFFNINTPADLDRAAGWL